MKNIPLIAVALFLAVGGFVFLHTNSDENAPLATHTKGLAASSSDTTNVPGTKRAATTPTTSAPQQTSLDFSFGYERALLQQMLTFGTGTTITAKSGNFVFTKDKQHVYVDGALIDQADPDSFVFIGESPYAYGGGFSYYAKDATYVYTGYICGQGCLSKSEIIENADPNSFEFVRSFADADFEKDASRVYIGESVINGADPKTFTIEKTEDGYYRARDATGVYYVLDSNGAQLRDSE